MYHFVTSSVVYFTGYLDSAFVVRFSLFLLNGEKHMVDFPTSNNSLVTEGIKSTVLLISSFK